MAKTGAVYQQTERLKEMASQAFADLESDDDLATLQDNLNPIIELATILRDVVAEANPILARL